MITQPPFPEPIEIELEIVLTYVHFAILIFMIVLMLYLYQKLLSALPIIILYLFSLYLGFLSMAHSHPPISPLFEIFFLVFQTSIFIISALEINDKR